jgi:nicotinate-nucleotide adenylyltransferase
LRIGLLGGSFNPAHEGHLHITREALKRLRLDYVWWLVSPQNPLKARGDMAPLDTRVHAAGRLLAPVPRAIATALESELGTRFTADTLGRLTARFSRTRFVWLMGADNLAQLPRWRRWVSILHRLPVAVFDRPPYLYGASAGRAATRFSRARLAERRAAHLALKKPPAWAMLHQPRRAISATAIRRRRSP